MQDRIRIAILFHEHDRTRGLNMYSIVHLSKFWIDAGHEVVYLFGIHDFVPADVIVVHIDLSVVPDEYLQFAAQYPAAVNARVRDIRKSTISKQLLTAQDRYDGKIIIKSNLNCAGQGERLTYRIDNKAQKKSHLFRSALDYRVFSNIQNVGRWVFDSPEYVVEKFLPEKQDDLYIIRLYQFLGDRESCFTMAGKHPIVNGSTATTSAEIEPDPEIRRIREELRLDYGKLDYVLREGKVILLDANKTTGYWPTSTNPQRMEILRRERAQGIYYFLDQS